MRPTCIIPECEKPNHRAGMCSKHEKRVRSHGDPYYAGKKGLPSLEAAAAGRAKGHAVMLQRKYERIEDFVDLMSWGVQDEEICKRMGLTDRTLWRYRQFLSRQAAVAVTDDLVNEVAKSMGVISE